MSILILDTFKILIINYIYYTLFKLIKSQMMKFKYL